MVIPNSLSVMGTPIDLKKIETPAYIQAGREDHIAPLASVWRLMDHLSGPKTFLLAGSGHIAGVVNPPAAGKYQYWTGDNQAATLDDFIAGATETRSEEHTSELQSIMRNPYAAFSLQNKKKPYSHS